MSEGSTSLRIEKLVEQAEEALRESRSRLEIETILERILAESETGSEARVFAHMRFAELLLETSPWQAALHLRNVVQLGRDTHVVHALLGLCYALLGHFHLAVAAYRRALVHAAENPWYMHNLGHILDVGLLVPVEAEAYLRKAHAIEPLEDEITASLAHCLASLGEFKEAAALAKEASELSPENLDHKALIDWTKRKQRAHQRREKKKSRGEAGTKPKVRASKDVMARDVDRSKS